MADKKILLVEGPDDEHVLKHLCTERGWPRFENIPLEVKQLTGVDRLLKDIPVQVKANGPGGIVGVVVDADTDIAARWRSMRDRLIGAGYEDVPDNPAPEGTILPHIIDSQAGKFLPRVGIWIMPDNRTEGILEDFLRFLVPAGSPLFEHVTSSVAAIPEGARLFGSLAEPKAVMHTWLAWQEKPGKSLGTAITARYLDPDVPQVDVLMSWLKRLFLPQSEQADDS
ncbi:MAG: hypothetical protein HQK58_10185 [Deltaproteobacteria bacterium]|nr:hypothetical protein [Deltaproteobacteria bacterium]